MSFFAFGFNYESSPAEARDTYALDEQKQRTLYQTVHTSKDSEWIVLSTCNRTEIFLFGSEEDKAQIKSAIGRLSGREWDPQLAFRYEDEAAVRHVLLVASGLKSLVLGDGQILSQVKQAYRIAVEENRVGAVMHRLMHSAFRAAKRVFHETSLTSGSVSISGAAVAMARAHFDERSQDGLQGKRVLVAGAGQMGRLALHVLKKQGLKSLSVTNRSRERALSAAECCNVGVVAWDHRYDAILNSDLVIVATGAQAPVIDRSTLLAAGKPKSPVLIVDIGVPRNVDHEVEELPDYQVLDLDALNAWISRSEQLRRDDVPKALAICEDVLSEYVSWMFHQQALQPGIQAIRETFEAIRKKEIERHHRRFSDADQHELEVLTSSILQKLLAVPIVRLKNVGTEDLDFARSIKLLQFLFSRPDCEDDEEELEKGAYEKLLNRLSEYEEPSESPVEPSKPVDSWYQNIREIG